MERIYRYSSYNQLARGFLEALKRAIVHLRGVAGVPQRMCIVGYLVSALMGERFSMFEAFVRRGRWSMSTLVLASCLIRESRAFLVCGARLAKENF